MTKTSIPPELYFDEYAAAAETERLAPTIRLDTTPAYLPRDPRPMQLVVAFLAVTLAIGIYTRSLLFSAGFAAGWAARELAGGLWDQRGWAALLVFSIVASSVIVHGRNVGR